MDAIDEERRGPRWRPILAALAGIAAAAALVALVIMLGQATRTRDDALGWQQHSYEVMNLARTLDATMAQSEASLGRFVISGDKDIGRIYFDGWRRAASLIDTLDSQVTDAGTQALIDRLRTAYDARGNELAAVALRTNYGQNPQALSRYYTAGKSPNLARLDKLVDAIIARQRAILQQRTAEADETISRSNSIGFILSIFGMVLAAGAAILGWAAVRAAGERRDQRARAEALESAVTARTAELSRANAMLRAEMATRETVEAALRQSQKMEAVGQLTGGIAHDFNNMLAVVVGGIEMAERRIGPDSAARRHLHNALEGAGRAAALTKRLLAFARAEPLLPVAADPALLIGGMSDLLDRTIGDTIAVRISPAAGIWPVFVDRHQLENAILNLAVNARDAMERGGTMTVALANLTLGAGEIAEAAAGDYVRIAVSDTGIGMEREVLDRVFEPFFTTKPAGKGTGLGLSQIFGFVRQSGGAIAVDSAPGTGTTVSLYLPRHHGTPAVERPSRPAIVDVPARHAGRTVLVIEDDPRVLAATVEALAELGHHPLPCAGAAEAQALVAERADIALIVSDVLMPGLTGPELVATIAHTHPDLPVLFVTGFAGDVEAAQAFAGHEVLRKPFTIAALGAAVDRALDRPSPLPAEAA